MLTAGRHDQWESECATETKKNALDEYLGPGQRAKRLQEPEKRPEQREEWGVWGTPSPAGGLRMLAGPAWVSEGGRLAMAAQESVLTLAWEEYVFKTRTWGADVAVSWMRRGRTREKDGEVSGCLWARWRSDLSGHVPCRHGSPSPCWLNHSFSLWVFQSEAKSHKREKNAV